MVFYSSYKKIKVLEDGPYEAMGNIPLNHLRYVPNARKFSLEYEELEKYETDEIVHLCRCGMSKDKPYCDGSHNKGFDGTETAPTTTYEEMAKFIEGKQIDLLDAEELCAGARFCDTKSGTWNLVETSNHPDAKRIVKHQTKACPSGRLTAVNKEGLHLEPKLRKEISALEDPGAGVMGPLWVKGGILIESDAGDPYPTRNRVTLCRCGKSKNKPFCDASHLKSVKE
ncbi:CDGSH-type Zn-finger protein [Parabacteroides sp. PF5-5]|uniref:CDGSH iron-sulfur domain-containing protein n=1 Tax=unclassified Parabacteroides TaxID=2649774 RepID=UPI002475BC77|nr:MULTISPECIES: CDGSH iron-sulfur domain-containing protein [unclassified Parabacteroides]MDH6306909.1 CDGSH-type Zn-finger protein [Parabacteroides sp. PH5-39]MDH6317703.1 CDGSH-type Zn-finger protein [Parabacteroides sp. PF5-13]MDH6321710.1 CDGSH-type Zn-finger protein [Parabacteroides sp. PH5-13]MDH6325296.1 CDGSH-type Zn-finger protein [Parabacteroides sp. PH5-8]MDH6328888.1 CDGSH-type Zn-finger protein [Parabacteroides sp. PH5-41]